MAICLKAIRQRCACGVDNVCATEGLAGRELPVEVPFGVPAEVAAEGVLEVARASE